MVWSTTQSSRYGGEREGEGWSRPGKICEEEEREPFREAPPKAPCKKRSPALSGLFDDSDTLLILGLLMILMREKSDQKLIFALLFTLLM